MSPQQQPQATWFRGANITALKMDQAFVNVSRSASGDVLPLFLYILSGDCYGCPFQHFAPLPGDDGPALLLTLSTHHPWSFRIRSQGQQQLVSQFDTDPFTVCQTTDVRLGEFGVYDLVVAGPGEPDQGRPCGFSEALQPANSSLALLFCALVLTGLALLFHASRYLWSRYSGIGCLAKLSQYTSQRDGPGGDPAPSRPKARVRSLDTFRGLTIALMIFVNDGAGGYWFLSHSTWNGLYVADLAFPWFMWIMGFCIPMSVKSLVKRKSATYPVLLNFGKRSATLFLLGLFWNTMGRIDLDQVRIPGVLQRFAIAYLVVAVSGYCLYSEPPGQVRVQRVLADSPSPHEPDSRWAVLSTHFTDILATWKRWLVAAVLLVAHFLLVFLLPVPGCPTGYLGPGGMADDNQFSGECVGGSSGYVDRVVFGTSHIYSNQHGQRVYGSGAFDPEGVVGSLTSIVHVFLGYQAGQIMLCHSQHQRRIIRWVMWAAVCGGIGLALCGASQNHGWIPINKSLWSISFVLVTTGLALVLFSATYILVDVLGWWRGQPFAAAGMNSIVLYLGHLTAANMLPFNYRTAAVARSHWSMLVECVWGVIAWMLVAVVLHAKKVYISI